MEDTGYIFNSPKYELVISDGGRVLSWFYIVLQWISIIVFSVFLYTQIEDIGYIFKSPKYEPVISDGDLILSRFYMIWDLFNWMFW